MTKKNNMSENQCIENILPGNSNVRIKQGPVFAKPGLVLCKYVLNLYELKCLQMNNFIVRSRRSFHNCFRHGGVWVN